MEQHENIPKRLRLMKKRLKQALALVGILIVTLALSGCEKFVETDVSAETYVQQTNLKNEESAPDSTKTIYNTLVKNQEYDLEIDECTVLKKKMYSLKTMLEKDNINYYLTYGIIDYNNDGINEFFAVFSNGNQGYNEIIFYNIDDDYNINPLFSTSGFSRDGKTYFMYDNVTSQLLIFSYYEHSYFLKNEKIESVNQSGKISKLFESTWTTDSNNEPFSQTDVYLNSLAVSADKYNIAYNDFISKSYDNVFYIYDEVLFCGSNLISDDDDIYQSYILKTGGM